MYNFLLEIEQGEDDADVQQGENMSTMVEEWQSGRFVTAREYYCYLMQVREGLFNIMLFGGWLFQQWVVDMYVKIESMRLDWYSNPDNQKLIRAELYQVSYAMFYYLQYNMTQQFKTKKTYMLYIFYFYVGFGWCNFCWRDKGFRGWQESSATPQFPRWRSWHDAKIS